MVAGATLTASALALALTSGSTAATTPELACLQNAQSTAARDDCVGAAYAKAKQQLAAAYGREDVLIQVASQLEQAAPWAQRRPPVHA